MKERQVTLKQSYTIIENGDRSVTIGYVKPETEHPHDNPYTSVNYKEVLDAFNPIIIDAIDKRLESCFDELYNHTEDVISANECVVTFKKDNGKYHSFHTPTYDCMIGILTVMQRRDYDALDGYCLDQIIKSLFWIEKPKDIDGISFADLISCLMEMFLFSGQR